MMRNTWHLALLVSFCLIVSGCGNKDNSHHQAVRSIKVYTVKPVANEMMRRLSGTVEAAKTANLSFQIPGRIDFIIDKTGQEVKKGEQLASLDETTYKLKVNGAEAELRQAEAKLLEAKTRYIANKKLRVQRHVSEIDFRRAEADYKVAENNVELAKAKLNIQRNKLNRATLYAPFNARIVKTFVKLHTEVQAGEQIIKLNGVKSYEVPINMPDVLINLVHLGQSVIIDFVTLNNLKLAGKVTEIGTSTDAANVYPVTVKFSNPPKQVRPGMTVEVIFNFTVDTKTNVFLLPINAIVPTTSGKGTYVFLYDSKTKTVRKHRVYANAVRDNLVVVSKGLRAGDQVATSGVRFLVDKQKVSIYRADDD
jgi:membrane fusion protein, multidrug efflux system